MLPKIWASCILLAEEQHKFSPNEKNKHKRLKQSKLNGSVWQQEELKKKKKMVIGT